MVEPKTSAIQAPPLNGKVQFNRYIAIYNDGPDRWIVWDDNEEECPIFPTWDSALSHARLWAALRDEEATDDTDAIDPVIRPFVQQLTDAQAEILRLRCDAEFDKGWIDAAQKDRLAKDALIVEWTGALQSIYDSLMDYPFGETADIGSVVETTEQAPAAYDKFMAGEAKPEFLTPEEVTMLAVNGVITRQPDPRDAEIARLTKIAALAIGQVKTAYIDGYTQAQVNEDGFRGTRRYTPEEAWKSSDQKTALDHFGSFDDGSFEGMWNQRDLLRNQLQARDTVLAQAEKALRHISKQKNRTDCTSHSLLIGSSMIADKALAAIEQLRVGK